MEAVIGLVAAPSMALVDEPKSLDVKLSCNESCNEPR